jgi:ATP-binding cassette subfamily F protein 3
MIQINDLSISHGDTVLFTNASFSINPGDRCGLVGRNGSGKTTLLRLLVEEERPDSGTLLIPKGYHLGYLDQHIRFSCSTVIEEATLGLKAEDRDNTFKAERILFGLGFNDEQLSGPIEQLSGGFHLRLHLAKVLLAEPNCLLLDEPTNYLDILSLRFLTRFLRQWTGELILISHDREFMDAVTTHTLGIHRRHVRKVKGTTADFFSLIASEEQAYERTRENVAKRREHIQTFISRLGAKASKASQARSKKKMLEAIPALEALKSIDELDFSFREEPFHGDKLGELASVHFSYPDMTTQLITDVSFTIGSAERIAIVGRNGYGKSTLLKLLARELHPSAGSIVYAANVATGYFGQTHIQHLNPNATAEAAIAAANPSLSYSDVRAICGQMMFRGKDAEKPIRVLSGGEKSRVLLGTLLAKPCNLLLLDEPTHHLDVESVEALIEALETFAGTVIIVSHSELLLHRLNLDQLIVCHAGRQETYLGGYEEFLEKVGWQEEAIDAPKPKLVDRSEERRRRADLVTQRAKVLRPIKEQMDRLEASIMALEEEQQHDQHQLDAALATTGAPAMQELFMRLGKRSKEIDRLFEELMALGRLYEAKKSDYSPPS